MKFCSPWHFGEFFLLLQEDYNHFKIRILQYLMLRHFKFEFTPFAVEKVLGKKNDGSSASFSSLEYAIPNVATHSKIHVTHSYLYNCDHTNNSELQTGTMVTARQRNCGKVMYSQSFVSHSVV